MGNSSYKGHYNIKSKDPTSRDLFFTVCITAGDGRELGVHWVTKRYNTHVVFWHLTDERGKDEWHCICLSRCWLVNPTKMLHLDDLNLSPNHSRPFVKLFLDSPGCENLPKKKLCLHRTARMGAVDEQRRIINSDGCI